VVLAALAASAMVAACTQGHPHSRAAGHDAAHPGGGLAGTAVLTVAGREFTLAVQRCVQSGPSSVNLTAYDVTTKGTLVANLTKPVSASTLVYTARGAHNAFTNYALATTVVHTRIAGGVEGRHLRLSGQAAKQSYRPDGKSAGAAARTAIDLDASCITIQPPQSAPSYAPSPTHRRGGHPKHTARPTASPVSSP
jgi:hypothetical protein